MSKSLFAQTALIVLSVLAMPKAMAQSINTVSLTSDADQNWGGIDPATAVSSESDEEKIVYFYNVGKKKFMGRGGRWGTECVLSDVGQPYTITKDGKKYKFKCNIKQKEGDSEGYLYVTYKAYKKDCFNYFSDDQYGTGFMFTEVQNSSNKKIYQIYSKQHTNSAYTPDNGDTYWFMVAQYNTGSYTYEGTTYKSTSTDKTTAINYFVNSTTTLSSISDQSDQWILVTKAERKKKFLENQEQRYCRVPGTAMIQDYDFARKDQTVNNWTDADGNALSNGGIKTIPASSESTDYYVGNNTAQDDDDNQGERGRYMAANMVGANGTIKQTIENVFLPGWYEIRCKAFTTSTTGKATLFAQTGSGTEDGKTSIEYSEAHVKTLSTRPTDYLAAAKTVANDDYEIAVCVYVSKAQIQEDGFVTCNPLTFGVKIANGSASDLTTIDDFELTYRGTVIDKVVLDESNEGATTYKETAATTTDGTTKTNVTYMEAQNNERTQEGICELYIKRTLKTDKWNSIILPFRLTNEDIKAYWGDKAKVSEFVGADDANNPRIINFKLTTDGIYPNKLYLIKPTALNTTTLAEDVTSTNATTSEGSAITLTAGTDNVYKIESPRYGVDKDENTVEYKKEVILGDTGKELNTDASNKIQFAGTYFYQKSIVPGESYYIMDNKWYYSATDVTNHSKGFRAWVQRAAGNTSPAKSYTFYIDGINATGYETTGIEGISADSTLPCQFDIYNVSGQRVRHAATSLDGLSKGIYIVAGKKFIVK